MITTDDKSADSIDPEFLTFRHNSPQALPSSGRSIYSQRFDYKSLQKYTIFDANNSQRDDAYDRTCKKIKQNFKQKHLRTVKSQDKYRRLLNDKIYKEQQKMGQEPDWQNVQVYRREINNEKQGSIKAYNMNKNKSRKQGETDKNVGIKNQSRTSNQQNIEKNIELKSKLSKLVRNMKKQQRKQILLDQQINQLQNQVESMDRQAEQQQRNMMELKQISQQNMKECNRIIDHIRCITARNQQMAANLQNLEESVDSSEIEIQTSKQEQTKDRVLCLKLKQGVNDLIKMKNNWESKISRLQEQIQFIQCQIQAMRNQQMEFAKIFGFCSDLSTIQNHSHSHSHSQNHSYNSSSGSNRQNTYYY